MREKPRNVFVLEEFTEEAMTQFMRLCEEESEEAFRSSFEKKRERIHVCVCYCIMYLCVCMYSGCRRCGRSIVGI